MCLASGRVVGPRPPRQRGWPLVQNRAAHFAFAPPSPSAFFLACLDTFTGTWMRVSQFSQSVNGTMIRNGALMAR